MSNKREDILYNSYRYMLALVKAAVNGSAPPQPPAGTDWAEIYRIASVTSFACPVFYAVSALPGNLVPRHIFEKFYVDFQKSVARDAERAKLLNLLSDFCEEEQIDILPLKGSFLREFYPQTDMRYMMDIDVLVREEGLEKVGAFLVRRGFVLRSPGSVHDEYFCKRTGVIVEVHKKLIAEGKTNYPFFEHVWERAVLRKGRKHSYRMDYAEFYVYMAEHSVHHFFHGGITARMILDFYVFEQKLLPQADKARLACFLKETGLVKFTKKMNELAHDWFSPYGKGLQNEPLSRYIMLNGREGSIRNLVITNAAIITKNGEKPSKSKYVFQRVFPSAKLMSERFPVLNKKPGLAPVMIFPWWWHKLRVNLLHRGKKFKTIPYVKTLGCEQHQVDVTKKMIEELQIEHDM